MLPAPARARPASRLLRPLLMSAGVALLAVGAGLLWLRGGTIVSIDNAYIHASKLAIATDVSGIVAAVDVREGQQVRRGDVLLRLDDRAFRIAVQGAQAALAQASLDVAAMKRDYQRALRDVQAEQALAQSDQADFARFENIIRTGAVTQAETDDARFKLAADRQRLESLRAQAQMLLARLNDNADIDAAATPAYRQARARLDEAQRQLDHTIIRAPFDGVVTQVEAAQPGMYLAAATPAFALVATDQLWAEGDPKETELTWVQPGDHVEIHVDTYPGVTWTGVVESIAPGSASEFSILPAQNTSGNWVKVVQRIPLRVRIDRPIGGPVLRAGMSVVLDIDTGHHRRPADLIP
jgi:membrane fusion protein (multidrug efflux system)